MGEDLVKQGHFGAERIQSRLNDTLDSWKHLQELVAFRRKRLEEAVDFHQVAKIQEIISVLRISFSLSS